MKSTVNCFCFIRDCRKIIVRFFIIRFVVWGLQQLLSRTKPIILILMLDLFVSSIALIFFTTTTNNYDSCYYCALAYNIAHISSQIFIHMPLLFKLIKKRSLNNMRRQYIKNKVVSTYRMPIYCTIILMLSLTCLYSIIVNLFVWQNYGYLFTVFCLVCSSLSQVSGFFQLKFDCSIFFSLQTYKFFCLVVSSILFGISAHEIKLSAEILSMGWIYFVYRSKQSLPKQIIYYLILFMDVVILLTAIMVIGTSQSKIGDQRRMNNKFKLLFAVCFFSILFALELYEFSKLYRSFGRSGQFGQVDRKENSIAQFYLNIQKFKQNGAENPQNQDRQCSICLQNINKQKYKGDRLILKCGHHYHSECLEQWAYINQTCPLCRKSMTDASEVQISM